MFKYSRAFLMIASFSFCACVLPHRNKEYNPDKNKDALVKADEDFSSLSEKKGMKAAFLEYIDSNGVLLRPGVLPVAGADAVDYLIALNDTGYSLTWKPKGAAVAASGEMGYTYGVYELHPKLKDTLLYGTYVSIWKRQADGKWKYILDTGNEGIGDGNGE